MKEPTDPLPPALGLTNSERAIDKSILEATGLLGEIVGARRDLEPSAEFGVVASRKIAEAIQELAKARAILSEARDTLAAAGLTGLGEDARPSMLGEPSATSSEQAQSGAEIIPFTGRQEQRHDDP